LKREFSICFVSLAVVASAFWFAAFINDLRLLMFLSFGNIILGTSMVFLGFWGADFAFDAVRRGERFVHVPFMKDYEPLDWWNLNWFITAMGCALLALGSLMLGIVVRI